MRVISNLAVRTCDQVTNQTIVDIKDQILRVITNYKKGQEGIFKKFNHGAAIEILDALDAEINSFQCSPFEQFAKILNSVHSKFELLDNEKEFDLIRQLQVILASQLELQQEADWEQEKSYCKREYLADRIEHSLRVLSVSVEAQYESKWHIFGTAEEYGIWMYLYDNFTQRLDEGNLTTLLSELRSRFGLPSQSTLGDNSQDTCATGCLETIFSDAENEVSLLEKKYGCLYFGPEQSKVINEFNSRKYNEPDQASYLIQMQLIKGNKPDKDIPRFDQAVMDKIHELEANGDQKESRSKLLKDIKEIFNSKMKIHNLRRLVDDARKLVLGGNDDKRALINAIVSDKDGMFSPLIKEKIAALAEQLKIWTLENLIIQCREYLEYSAKAWREREPVMPYISPDKFLAEKFISPVINELIDPMKYILCEQTTETIDLKSVMEMLKANNDDQAVREDEAAEIIYKWPLASSELAVKASRLASFEAKGIELPEDSEIDSEAQNIGENNASLISALSAAYLYYTKAVGNTHTGDGKEATINFIQQLLSMEEKTHLNIQNEAIKFIQAQGIYGTWYGGASSHHKHSRISYILDSGLLDDRIGEIFPYKTSLKCGFFSHEQPYAGIKKVKSRKDLKDRVMSLPTPGNR